MTYVGLRPLVLGAIGTGLSAALGHAQPWLTPEPPQMMGLEGFTTQAILTIAEAVDGAQGEPPYRPPGILDGLGAYALDDETIRILVNHELRTGRGRPYRLANGTIMPSGARISAIDIDQASLHVTRGQLAFDTIIDGFGQTVDQAALARFGVVERLCSGSLAGPAQGLEDLLYFAGEEVEGGREFALDVDTRILHEVPALGHGAWENLVIIPTGGSPAARFTLAMLGDDRTGRPLYLWVGLKMPGSTDLLARNGLRNGRLHVFVAKDGANTNVEFRGTGAEVKGEWIPLSSNRPLEDIGSFDAFGVLRLGLLDRVVDRADRILNNRNLVTEAGAIGAFFFSRPEDVAANPAPKRRLWGEVAFASTGATTNLGDIDGDGENDIISDRWGTVYIAQVQLATILGPGAIQGRLAIAHDANDSEHRDFGIRNPDNLDWSASGAIVINEDRSTSGFGAQSGFEASVWSLDPRNGEHVRIAEMDRSAVPAGQFDFSSNQIGAWESSGILDVSALFGEKPGSTFLLDVQAHSVGGGDVRRFGLVEGGQLLVLRASTGESSLAYDLDGDGQIGFGDLTRWLESSSVPGPFGEKSEPPASVLLDLLRSVGRRPSAPE